MQIVTQLITSPNRPHKIITPTYLTIHNTADPGASAQNIRDYFQNHSEVKASAHWAVDGKEAINMIPENEMAWHTGTTSGNLESIGVEICEVDGVYENGVLLAADVLHRHALGIERMRTHQSWSGKYCPRLIIPKWNEFVNDVKEALIKLSGESVTVKLNGKIIPAKAVIQNGITFVEIGGIKQHVADLAKALGASKAWDEKNKIVNLTV